MNEPKFKLGDRVWVESAQQYGTITAVREPGTASVHALPAVVAPPSLWSKLKGWFLVRRESL